MKVNFRAGQLPKLRTAQCCKHGHRSSSWMQCPPNYWSRSDNSDLPYFEKAPIEQKQKWRSTDRQEFRWRPSRVAIKQNVGSVCKLFIVFAPASDCKKQFPFRGWNAFSVTPALRKSEGIVGSENWMSHLPLPCRESTGGRETKATVSQIPA